MITGLIFDLDYTLYPENDFVDGGFKAVSRYMEKNYFINSDLFYDFLYEDYKLYNRGGNFNRVLEHFNLLTPERVLELIGVYRNHTPCIELYPGVRDMLESLKKNYLLGLITDGNTKVQKNKVTALELEAFFDVLFFTDEYDGDWEKPIIKSYSHVLRVLGTSPPETCYIGDNPYKDFISARKLGMKTLRIKQGLFKDVLLSPEYEADYMIDSIIDLIKVIPGVF